MDQAFFFGHHDDFIKLGVTYFGSILEIPYLAMKKMLKKGYFSYEKCH